MADDLTANPIQVGDENLADNFSFCSSSGELSPSGVMPEGQSVWIGKGDAESSLESGRTPFCTDGEWVERHSYQDSNDKFCEVGEDGLDVGAGRFAGPDDDEVNICRDSLNTCVPCNKPGL